MCTNKKTSHTNVLFDRGKSVETEATISKEVLTKNYSKEEHSITAETIVRINYLKNYVASTYSGTLTGFNANVANTVAALFAATGQYLAQIVESSTAFTYAEVLEDGSFYFGVLFPSIEVGTEYGTAKEALEILGCRGLGEFPGKNALKLAEIIASAATAQELNLLGTLGQEYELVDSHIRLARGG